MSKQSTLFPPPSGILLYAILFSAVASPGVAQASVGDICKKAAPDYVTQCASILDSTPGARNGDVSTLSRLMLDALIGNLNTAVDRVTELIREQEDPAVQRPLTRCAEMYLPVLKYELPDAVQALQQGHPKFARYNILQAGAAADACEKSFSGSMTSPITDFMVLNRFVGGLAIITAGIVGMLS